MKYLVSVREVHIQMVEVEAESPEDAKEKVAEGEGRYLDNALEYSHSLEPDTWTVDSDEAEADDEK
jgi:hypothetical protein